MYARSLDLILAATVAIATLLMVLLGVHNSMLRAVLGIPLALVLPGYTLIVAIFPSYTLRRPEQVVFSLCLSLVVAALGGFILNLLPWGLQATPWAFLLGGITLAASGVAHMRRSKQVNFAVPPWYAGINMGTGFLFGLLILVVIVMLWGNRLIAMQEPPQDFTQLWVLPASASDANGLRVGVHNMEAAALTYHLQVVSGATLIEDWPSIALAPNNTWEVQISLPTNLAVTEPVVVRLYRLDQPDVVYRQGIFWPRRE